MNASQSGGSGGLGSAIQELEVRSTAREEMIDITAQVRTAVRRSGFPTGVAWIYCPHTTAAITIQENSDPDLRKDIVAHLAQLVPQPGFRHNEGNADAHIKCSLFGASQAVLVDAGKPVLGTWQAVYLCEFDGPRVRRVLVKVMGG